MDDETPNSSANKKNDDGERSARDNWPEAVGLTGEEAKNSINEENSLFHLEIVGPDHMVTADFRMDRVRIYVDSDGKVIRTPTVG
ncbi:hypothetical protein KSP39_PZI013409 [Platanthera zijinensis]|uniref:Uncharacterized protein n=1 Tax=Platanthera zijinensis TaxID=2320716 RepID=A0AAP0BDX6_9ASPA